MKDDLLHGGALDRMRTAFPDAPEPWIDLSTGINPFGYPDVAVRDGSLRHLPHAADMDACAKAMAAAIGAPAETLVLAPGSELLIRLLPSVIAPARVAILAPSYGDHERVWRAAGAELRLSPEPLADAKNIDAVIVCNPNNPDGRDFSRAQLEQTRRALAARGGWLIVDEAYADLCEDNSLAPMGGAPGLIVLRSTGKFYGLAGLRMGAMIAPKNIRTKMAALLGVWPVSGPALEIARRAYENAPWRVQMRDRLRAARKRLDAALAAGGLAASGGTDLFRFVETENAEAVWRRLARAGIYVRRFSWSPHCLRIGLPPNADAETRLAKALRV